MLSTVIAMRSPKKLTLELCCYYNLSAHTD